MNDVEELKQFVVVHARAQNIPPERSAALLARIRTDDDGGGPGSWTYEWSAEADRLRGQGKVLEACQHYTMARFPFVDGVPRQEALVRALESFDVWRTHVPDVTELTADVDGIPVRCWSIDLAEGSTKPLMLIMGGIVSTKEQWAPVLMAARALGMAGIAAEMPGVGENPLRYDAGSWRMIPALIDAATGRADTTQTYAMALSFSGHLALRAAVHDHRIRGVVTAGAPLSGFFTDDAWWPRVPRVTVDTVASLCGVRPDEVREHIRDWAITPDEVAALDIPVDYIVARRDEIIPPGEADLLRGGGPTLRVHHNDDVHGSPEHVAETRLRVVSALLRMRRTAAFKRLVIGATLLRMRLTRRSS